tara:strand:- start:89 stop:556 length:468 start_codon:yes stop_codon:yes gene_type:complete
LERIVDEDMVDNLRIVLSLIIVIGIFSSRFLKLIILLVIPILSFLLALTILAFFEYIGIISISLVLSITISLLSIIVSVVAVLVKFRELSLRIDKIINFNFKDLSSFSKLFNKKRSLYSNSVDDILKLKELLDKEIITKEEYDEKAKKLKNNILK